MFVEKFSKPFLIFLALFSILGATYNILLVINLPAYHDAPILHFVAYRIINGDIPYRDFMDTNFPATYFLHWLVWLVFGNKDIGLMLLDIAAMISFCTFFSLLLGKKMFWESLLISGFILTYHYTNTPIFFVQRDVLMMPFLMGAAYFSYLSTFSPDKKNFLLFGALIALACLIKPVALVLLILIFVFNFRSYSWAGFLYTICGALIVALPFFLLMVATNSLVPFLRMVFEFLPSYSRWGRSNVNYLELCIKLLVFPITLFSLSIFYAQKSLLTSKKVLFLGILKLYSIIHYIVQKNWFYQVYLSELLDVMIAFYLVFLFCKRKEFSSVLILLCIVPILYCYSPLKKSAYDVQSIKDLTNSVEQDVTQAKSVFEHLHNTKPQTILALDFATNVHRAAYMSGLKPVSNMIYNYCFYNEALKNAYLDEGCLEFYAGLWASKPDIIIYSKSSWPFDFAAKQYAINNPSFMDVISSGYAKLKEQRDYVLFIRTF